MSKRSISVAILVIGLFAASGLAYIVRPQPTLSNRIKVVASFYPLAYMAEQLGGDLVDVKSLIQPGLEAHSWQPSIGDLVAASDADIILYNGAGLDLWVEDDILPAIDTIGKIVIDTSKNVELYKQIGSGEIGSHGVFDPHIWVSPYEAKKQAETIYEALKLRDPQNIDYYDKLWMTFSGKLDALDSKYQSELLYGKGKAIYVTHDAFGYVARRYGFYQHGIIGLSADEQPSTQTLVNIVELMRTEGSNVFYLEPGYSDIYVQTISTELHAMTGSDVKILKLYHLDGPVEGLDFIQQMERNLVSLREGLG